MIRGVPAASNVNKSAVACKTASALNRQRKEELIKEKERLEEEHNRLRKLREQVDGNIRDTLTNENTARYTTQRHLILAVCFIALPTETGC